MNPTDDSRDEELLASLLAAANKDMAGPDQSFLDRLREQSTEAFCSTAREQTRRQTRRRHVITMAVRGLAASVAAGVLLGVFLFFGRGPRESDLELGHILDKLSDSSTTHLALAHQGKKTDLLIRQHQLRWDEPDGTYRIARGDQVWTVNEPENRVTRQQAAFFGQSGEASLDVAAFLQLPSGQPAWSDFLKARPVEEIERDGRRLHVYRTEIPNDEGKLHIEALVDAATLRLHSMEVKADRNGKVEPISELTVLGYNEPVDKDKFVVKDTLTEDGRIGKITDAQGSVGVKPVMHERWTPVRSGLLLKPGDWVRTDVRGANAVALRLVKQTGVIMGPGTLIELLSPTQIRLSEGELEITVPDGANLELLAPNQQRVAIKGKQHYRLAQDKLVLVGKEPLWLKGFKGATADESIGSLIAKVDGRNVPLTVGYHKVAVDIRDQIARTVIEESFVNHTDAQLEGVFYFPLPQDASISGFGMWIGDNLIEADIVEKQRAREIYETILRERRDPGLLEWSGGNIFKARVFPIFAHSEKRIKITYTQVLPLKGSRYRYSYGLQSELLKQHPLRELAIDVKINSVVPLKSVHSPTHSTRADQTGHSGHVEFTAQEYTPTRDFEVVIEVDSRQADVVAIPHRRGEDGYFMLQLTPPLMLGDLQADIREVLPNSEPLQILILADTSASMDAGQRTNQAVFVASLLASLTSTDTFNLAGCDVDCDWVFEKAVPADAKNVATARQFLDKRTSLGWTDLDKAFTSALQRTGPNTHVIYVGDGIVTTGDADPVAFGQRLSRLYQGKAGIFHAVTTGNSFEPAAVKAIASLGSGSLRRISGEQGPQAVALELLGEISQPTLRDLKVEFKGVQVARVYPEQLPNIPGGSQQILLARYLPQGKDQVGEVVVTGTQGSRPVRFRTRIELKDAEQGNSFIPRLWARMHLDRLLEQGTSEAIKDEIIALSEEYNIITPYTSFLVLETDADRERFKVKQRFRMRDGEKYFAEGRDNAKYELVQQQMKKAGNWRLSLRRAVLQQLAILGRDARLLRQRTYEERLGSIYAGDFSRLGDRRLSGGESFDEGLIYPSLASLFIPSYPESAPARELDKADGFKDGVDAVFRDRAEFPLEQMDEVDLREKAKLPAGGPEPEIRSEVYLGGVNELPFNGMGRLSHLLPYSEPARGHSLARSVYESPFFGLRIDREWGNSLAQSINTLFPSLAGAPAEKSKEPKSTWPAAAQALARSLLRTDQLAKLMGGIEIERKSEHFDVRWNELASRSRRLELYSRTQWLTRAQTDGEQSLVNWCDGKERGVYGEAFPLGRVRASKPQELNTPPFELSDYSLVSIERSYPNHTVALEQRGMDRSVLILKHPSNSEHETHVLVDTARHVILSIERRHKGKATGTRRYDDFVEVAGTWWARKLENVDGNGRVALRITQTIKEVASDALEQHLKKELAGKEQVQFIHEPLPSLADAKRALAQGKATFDDQLVPLLHFGRSQQWTRTVEHLEQMERLAVGKPGVRWVRYAALHASRRHEELKKKLTEEAETLAKSSEKSTEELYLANYLLGQASGILQANEMLAFLDTLGPIFERQPSRLHATKTWQQQRVNYLPQAGRNDEALSLHRQLAVANPRDYNVQQQYAQALVNVSDYEAAYAWLTKALANKEAQWLSHEERSLRGQYGEFLYQQGRYAELAKYLSEWVERNPEEATPYKQYLSALIRANQVDKANALIAQWIKEGQVAGDVAPAAAGRLQAAVDLALGQGHNLSTNRIEERWLNPLAEVVLFFAKHPSQSALSDHIMSQSLFQQTDECRRVRKTVARMLTTDSEKLAPEQIQRFVNWIWPNDPAIEPAVWKQLADRLRQRWSAEKNPESKHQLAQPLVQILNSHVGIPELLAFLRVQRQQGPEQYRSSYANQLFNTLLGQPWSAAYEDEALGLLDKLSDADDQGERLTAQVAGLYRLTDAMVQARFQASMQKVEHPEKLTRTQLRKTQEDNLRKARGEFADRLAKEKATWSNLALLRWLTIERFYLDTLLERNLKDIAAACWDELGTPPAKRAKAAQPATVGERLEAILQDRYLSTLTYLATRPSADTALVDRLLKYLDTGIAGDIENHVWKTLKYRLLIALDRPRDLEQALQQWIRTDDPESRWRISLANLLAEQGKIAEAIKLAEAVELSDELGPMVYRTLADWYMVANRREQHDRTWVAANKTMDEYALSRWLSAKLYPWQRGDGHPATELDKEVLLIFAALFEKSSWPANYLGQLQQFYQACRDFRLLSGLADAVVGHTAAKVYPFLQGMGPVLGEIRNEADVDELIKHLNNVRERAKTGVDQRALDLLEVLVERRAAELKNQPGPHLESALAALKRAFKREWSAGEQRLMADLLANLGAISQPALAKEQLRQLEALHHEQTRGALDRLSIAESYAQSLGGYSRTAEAVDLLESALKEFQDANNGVLPTLANSAISRMIQYLQSLAHHTRAEKYLLAQLEHPIHKQQERWLTEQLYHLYHHALQTGGSVSLGTGQTLYQALERALRARLGPIDHDHRYNLVQLLCAVYRTAHDKKFPGIVEDVKAFAGKEVPELLQYQTSHYANVVSTVSQILHDLAGVREGLAFLIQRIEQEPGWFRFNNQDGWSQHAGIIADWRRHVKNMGDLEERLLKIVVAELRRDLETRRSRNRCMYHRHDAYFWPEKADAFAKVAQEVWTKHQQSGAAVRYIAEYLFVGLERHNRAIEMLFLAHNQKLLDESGQWQLVDYLHQTNRHGEMIALLLPMIKHSPTNLQYRTMLMHAYFRTNRPTELQALLKETDDFFHKDGRWTESTLAGLAHSCLENQLFTESVNYYVELITLYQRNHPNRGIGDGTLADYYAKEAKAYKGLKKTAEAVDAASAAIVSWGPTHANRQHALDVLREVLRESPDLDAYVAQLDKLVAESGQDRPIVRKAIGQIYRERKKYAQAIAQLQLAVELQPNDAETHRDLVACYDDQGEKEGAIRQVFQSIELARRDIKLYEDLGRRLEELKQAKEVERAYTSIVEVVPSESESHVLLAEIRQKKNRWSEAMAEWEQVARIRALEPTGLVNLAEAQVHEKQWDQATETVRKLNAKTWPARFDQLPNQIRKLQQQIEQGKK